MFYFTHLEETPITGRARLLVFGKEHFRELSQLEYDMVRFSRKIQNTLKLLMLFFSDEIVQLMRWANKPCGVLHEF